MSPAHCVSLMALVPESVSRSMVTWSERRRNVFHPASSMALRRSSGVVMGIRSTTLILYGSNQSAAISAPFETDGRTHSAPIGGPKVPPDTGSSTHLGRPRDRHAHGNGRRAWREPTMTAGLDAETLEMTLDAVRDFTGQHLPESKLLELDAADEMPLELVRQRSEEHTS